MYTQLPYSILEPGVQQHTFNILAACMRHCCTQCNLVGRQLKVHNYLRSKLLKRNCCLRVSRQTTSIMQHMQHVCYVDPATQNATTQVEIAGAYTHSSRTVTWTSRFDRMFPSNIRSNVLYFEAVCAYTHSFEECDSGCPG